MLYQFLIPVIFFIRKLKQKVDKKVEEEKQQCQGVEEKDQEKPNQDQETN